MMRILPGLVLAASLAQALPPAAQPPAAGPPVRIDFTAIDRKGAAVVDLKPEEVEVWIGHFRVPIEGFEAVTPASENRGARTIVLLLDDVTIQLANMARVKEVARGFVTKMMPGDRMAVVMVDGRTLDITDDPARLMRAIDAYSMPANIPQRFDVLGEQVLKIVADLSRRLIEAPGRRKTIVAIGSGWLFDRPIPAPTAGRELLPEWTDAMRAMGAAHVSLYVIDPAGLTGSRTDNGATGFAHASGGRAYLNTNNFAGATDQILRDTANYYVLRVSDPPVGRGATLRELEVRVRRRGVTALARQAIPGGS
jgi:VWFA-related protein